MTTVRVRGLGLLRGILEAHKPKLVTAVHKAAEQSIRESVMGKNPKAKVIPKTVSFLVRVGEVAHKATVQRFECPAPYSLMPECPQEGAVVGPGKHLCKDFCHAKMAAKD